jgi:hypothetical protein
VCILKDDAEFLLLSELTVPVGIGRGNGVVGVPEVDVDVEEEDDVDIVLDDDPVRCWSDAGMGWVDVSEATGDAKVPDICVRLRGRMVQGNALGCCAKMISNKKKYAAKYRHKINGCSPVVQNATNTIKTPIIDRRSV